jgi:signal transduction histidine kinase
VPKLRNLGLFQILFGRVAAVLATTMAAMLFLTHAYYQHELYRAWTQDLKSEAVWTAVHWRINAPVDMSKAWRSTHSSVRLTVRNARGALTVDSHPERGPIPAARKGPLIAEAPVKLADGVGQLTLTHEAPTSYPWSLGLLVGAGLIVVLATAAVYPVVSGVRRTFAQLSALARRVADGEFGATLKFSGKREFDDLIRALNDMSVRLEREEQRKRRLLTDVSHELRSPLARLRALTDTIGRRPREARDYLAGVEAEIALMDRLIGDLLRTARFEEGDAALHRETIDLGDWAQDAFDRLRTRIEGAHRRCDLSIADGSIQAFVDPQRLVQAFGNLVENAITATSDTPDAVIELRLTHNHTSWSLVVADNGRGIPEADLPFLFDRFFRVESHRDRRTGGVGLGLSLVKAITEAHGGRPAVSSREGEGTVVTLSFPLKDAMASRTTEKSRQHPVPARNL